MNIPSIAKKALKFGFFIIFVLTVSFGIFEWIARIGFYEPNIQMYDYTILFDSEKLFYINPNCAPDINEMGYRGASFSEEKTRSRKRIIFLGDSFVMGHNVSPDQTMAAGLAQALKMGFEVFNMGILAYGPDQSLVSLKKDGVDLEPDMVILGVFPANDYQDVVRNRLYSLDGGGRLTRNEENVVTENVPRLRTFFLLNHLQFLLQPKIDPNHLVFTRNHEILKHNLFDDFYDTELLFRPHSEQSQRRIDLMRSIFARYQEETDEIGAEFAVVIIPSYLNIVDKGQFLDLTDDRQHFDRMRNSEEGFFGPENLTASLCEELEIPYLNLWPEFMAVPEEERILLFDPSDWHLSPSGNRLAGELAASVLVRPRLTGLSGTKTMKQVPGSPWL